MYNSFFYSLERTFTETKRLYFLGMTSPWLLCLYALFEPCYGGYGRTPWKFDTSSTSPKKKHVVVAVDVGWWKATWTEIVDAKIQKQVAVC